VAKAVRGFRQGSLEAASTAGRGYRGALARTRNPRREARVALLGLTGMVLALDAAWALSGSGTGSLSYGLIDEPAHLATCAIALILLALCGRSPAPTFVAAALVASVAIDLDHAPQHLGFGFLTAGTARPYFHCALAVLVPLAGAIALPRWRPLLLGVAFGFAAHLARDLVTGPGVPLALPFSESSVRLSYVLYVGAMAAMALACLVQASAARSPATQTVTGKHE
jgi:membrane-bound metal-dependent hydrolase YbcI (DUF457 family)